MLPDLFKRLKPLYGKRIDELWIFDQIATPEDKQAIEAVLTILAVKRLGIAIGDEKITLEPSPFHAIVGGEYTIGNIKYLLEADGEYAYVRCSGTVYKCHVGELVE